MRSSLIISRQKYRKNSRPQGHPAVLLPLTSLQFRSKCGFCTNCTPSPILSRLESKRESIYSADPCMPGALSERNERTAHRTSRARGRALLRPSVWMRVQMQASASPATTMHKASRCAGGSFKSSSRVRNKCPLVLCVSFIATVSRTLPRGPPSSTRHASSRSRS